MPLHVPPASNVQSQQTQTDSAKLIVKAGESDRLPTAKKVTSTLGEREINENTSNLNWQ